MAPSDLLNSFLQDTPPRHIKLAAAKGAVPIAAAELLVILVHLTSDKDGEVAGEAVKTIQGLRESEILAQVRSKDCSTALLEFLSRTSESQPVLEAIILSQATPASVIEYLATRVPEELMETVLYNRVRILECPGILENLRMNPGLTPGIERQIREIELDFFSGKKKNYSVALPEEEIQTADAAPVQETESPAPTVTQTEADLSLDDLILEGLPIGPDEREIALSERLSRMTVPQKIRCAMQGNREARAVLIRDTNKEVARSVLKSPKVSESEVQAFAAMRNIADELLRVIGESRQWSRNYAVVQNLVKNPKTPPLTAQHLLNRLHSKDLVQLSRDRAVSEAVRCNAQRMVTQRNMKGGAS